MTNPACDVRVKFAARAALPFARDILLRRLSRRARLPVSPFPPARALPMLPPNFSSLRRVPPPLPRCPPPNPSDSADCRRASPKVSPPLREYEKFPFPLRDNPRAAAPLPAARPQFFPTAADTYHRDPYTEAQSPRAPLPRRTISSPPPLWHPPPPRAPPAAARCFSGPRRAAAECPSLRAPAFRVRACGAPLLSPPLPSSVPAARRGPPSNLSRDPYCPTSVSIWTGRPLFASDNG